MKFNTSTTPFLGLTSGSKAIVFDKKQFNFNYDILDFGAEKGLITPRQSSANLLENVAEPGHLNTAV